MNDETYHLRTLIDKLERENSTLREINFALRNEVARLNGQTQWKCSCGGTDCDGQAENAALRTENAALAKAFDRLGKKLDQLKAVDKGMKNTQ